MKKNQRLKVMGKIKYICKDFNDRRKSAFSSSLWPIYQFHLNLAVAPVSFYATPLSSEDLSCRLRAVWQIKRLPQDVEVLQSHWSLSLYFAFPCEALLCFCQLWQPHPSNSFFRWHFAFLSLSFPEESPLYFITSPFGHIFLSHFPKVRGCCHSLLHVTHPQSMLAFFFSKYILPYNSNQSCLQRSWIWFPHSTFEYCLTVKRYPQRWQFLYGQLISAKLFVLSLAQDLVKGG